MIALMLPLVLVLMHPAIFVGASFVGALNSSDRPSIFGPTLASYPKELFFTQKFLCCL
jgi:hypothetical protein